jgi:pyruvate-formate lyase-activating enzyme
MNNPIQTEHLLQFLRECKDMSLKTDTQSNIFLSNAQSERVIKNDNSPQSITLSFSNFKIDIKFSGIK